MKFTKISTFVASMLVSALVLTAAEVAQSPSEIHPLIPGSEIPDAVLLDASGETKHLAEVFGDDRVIAIFYRGGWCPYCNKHLEDLQKHEEAYKDLGFRVVAISPDKPKMVTETIEDGIGYELYSDSTMQTASAFGVAYQVDDETINMLKKYRIDLNEHSGESHHLLPVPAVFILDDGKVEFTYVNPDYKTRLSGDVVLEAAKFVRKL